jgi:hypothetical protein
MFALSQRPRNPELQQGELLLLQLVKTDAISQRRTNERINFALIFDRIVRDVDGTISRRHWPAEGRVWQWIIYGIATVPTVPFSLDEIGLSRDYSGQDNARYIEPQDEEKIRQYVLWSLAQVPDHERQIIPAHRIAETFGSDRSLTSILNHDRIERLHPTPVRTVHREEFVRNTALADMLKAYYSNRCQVCQHGFEARYGVDYSEAHHIQYLSKGGPDISPNMVVLCPNHHRVIHETNADFRIHDLTYVYPNGLQERLALADHFVRSSDVSNGDRTEDSYSY